MTNFAILRTVAAKIIFPWIEWEWHDHQSGFGTWVRERKEVKIRFMLSKISNYVECRICWRRKRA